MMFMWSRCAQPAMHDEAAGEISLGSVADERSDAPEAEGQQFPVGPVLLGRVAAAAEDRCGPGLVSGGSAGGAGGDGEEARYAEFRRFLEKSDEPDLDPEELVQWLRELRGVSAVEVMEQCMKAWLEQGKDEGLELLSAAIMADYACRQEEWIGASGEGAEAAASAGELGPIVMWPAEAIETEDAGSELGSVAPRQAVAEETEDASSELAWVAAESAAAATESAAAATEAEDVVGELNHPSRPHGLGLVPKRELSRSSTASGSEFSFGTSSSSSTLVQAALSEKRACEAGP